MPKYTPVLTCLALLLLCGVTLAAFKHPGVGHAPKLDLAAAYVPDATDASLTRGDLTFSANRPALSDLTPEDVYIVAGAKASDLPDGRSLAPWADQIFTMVLAFEREHGTVPAVLDDAAIRSVPYYANISSAELEVYRNPYTGQWPRLDADLFSPGDLYVRKLSEAEMREYARLLHWEERWFGSGPGPHLCSPVFYQRIYGLSGPIYESLPHICCER